MKAAAVVFFAILAVAAGHGAIVQPRSRNAVDFDQPMKRGQPPCGCSNGTSSCSNGQACYWYNQGCFIGCDTCDNLSGRAQSDLCGKGKVATNNDPNLRTVNRNATALSELDIYQHNPWRAPGSAPVGDACGFAGGTPWGPDVGEWGQYTNTSGASHGDHGSTHLKKTSKIGTAVWKAGDEVEVVWQITANHGGGYQYRIAPADQPLTDGNFAKTPLEFNQAKQALLFHDGFRLPINGTFTDKGTLPAGSTWAMSPIPPRCLGGSCHEVSSAKPFCKPCPLPVINKDGVARDCTTCDNTPEPAFPPPCDEKAHGACSGNEASSSVVDFLKIPATLKPGEYVLQWRLDCEATAQVWTNCADVEVVA